MAGVRGLLVGAAQPAAVAAGLAALLSARLGRQRGQQVTGSDAHDAARAGRSAAANLSPAEQLRAAGATSGPGQADGSRGPRAAGQPLRSGSRCRARQAAPQGSCLGFSFFFLFFLRGVGGSSMKNDGKKIYLFKKLTGAVSPFAFTDLVELV